MAVAFARLANPDDLAAPDRNAAQRVVGAMTRHPEIIAGTGRFDTSLGQFAGERLVTKGGAEGIQCIGLIGQGIGIAVKISDGSSRSIPAVCVPLLSEYLPDLDWCGFESTVNRPIVNTLGDQVGSIRCAFD